jgi:hypothetical protein
MMKLYRIKDKLEYKISKDINIIMNYVVSTCKINLTQEEIDKFKVNLR